MKVQIEKTVKDLDLLIIINKAIEMALNSENLEDCISLFKSNINSNFIEYGKGSNHVWLSIKDKRILLITE
jgi:hypothetical protein